MTRSKLSDLEKQEIVSLLDQKQETIPGLAHRYQVSASTIRRLLKQSNLDAVETIEAIEPISETIDTPKTSVPTSSGKPKPITKAARAHAPFASGETAISVESPTQELPPIPLSETALRLDKEDAKPAPRPSRRRGLENGGAAADLIESSFTAPVLRSETNDGSEANDASELSLGAGLAPDQEELSAILEEIGHGLEVSRVDPRLEDDEDDEDDDDFDDLDNDGDDDGDDDDLGNLMLTGGSMQLRPEVFIEVMPLDQADMPKTCYLVIDRTAELVTRPLKDFGELGQIPETEVQSRTLPVFDNHRIARRFSHRTHRIIKVPNGNMLKTTCAQLSAKGITRLLVNGRIYAL